jgi:hypothetical protein
VRSTVLRYVNIVRDGGHSCTRLLRRKFAHSVASPGREVNNLIIGIWGDAIDLRSVPNSVDALMEHRALRANFDLVQRGADKWIFKSTRAMRWIESEIG